MQATRCSISLLSQVAATHTKQKLASACHWLSPWSKQYQSTGSGLHSFQTRHIVTISSTVLLESQAVQTVLMLLAVWLVPIQLSLLFVRVCIASTTHPYAHRYSLAGKQPAQHKIYFNHYIQVGSCSVVSRALQWLSHCFTGACMHACACTIQQQAAA